MRLPVATVLSNRNIPPTSNAPSQTKEIGIVSLNSDQIMGKVIAECARKIERIDSCSCDCPRKR